MAAETPTYKRLPGRSVRLFGGDSLWIADDHILSVDSARFTEHYRRFYFRDIQAIALQMRKATGFAMGDPVVLAAALGFAVFSGVSGNYAVAVLLLLMAVAYGLARALRRTCTAWIQTAVSVEKLPSLRRVRPSMEALAIIEERVRAAQAGLTVPQADPPRAAAEEVS